MRCNTCGDYIAKGKKFNARKETVETESYLGLKIFRFYFKCPRCMQEITFKTDPKNMDYEVEHGATPNFKALKLAEQQAVQEQKDLEEEEKLNPMKLLENRTKQSKREMENIEALEDLKELNQRNRNLIFEAPINLTDDMLAAQQQMSAQEIQEAIDREYDAEEQQLLAQLNGNRVDGVESDEDSDESEDEALPKFGITFSTKEKDFTNDVNHSKDSDNPSNMIKDNMKRKINQLVVVKKKTKVNEDCQSTDKKNDNNSNVNKSNNLLNLCAYSSSDDDSD